jgi:hypothetical protein
MRRCGLQPPLDEIEDRDLETRGRGLPGRVGLPLHGRVWGAASSNTLTEAFRRLVAGLGLKYRLHMRIRRGPALAWLEISPAG